MQWPARNQMFEKVKPLKHCYAKIGHTFQFLALFGFRFLRMQLV